MRKVRLLIGSHPTAWRAPGLASALHRAGWAVFLEFLPDAETWVTRRSVVMALGPDGGLASPPDITLGFAVSGAEVEGLGLASGGELVVVPAPGEVLPRGVVALEGVDSEGPFASALSMLERRIGPRPLAGRRLLVTAGPTLEYLDAVRFLSNPSSGRMGYAVAGRAWELGAQVTLVSGPSSLPCPPGVDLVPISSAAELADACVAAFGDADAVVMAAAVADYRPETKHGGKLKKQSGPLLLELERTEDVLMGLSRRRKGQRLVGFAMETGDLEEKALGKLRRKGLDLIVGNDLEVPGAGFQGDTNVVTLIDAAGSIRRLPCMSKRDVASAILDHLASLLSAGPLP